MSKGYGLYSIYDKIDNVYVLENATSQQVSDKICIDKSFIYRYVFAKTWFKNRYRIIRVGKNQDENEQNNYNLKSLEDTNYNAMTVEMREEWDRVVGMFKKVSWVKA